MTPPATPESHLRNVLQALQGALELTAAGDLTLPRAALERWQALLVLALAALVEPPASPSGHSPTPGPQHPTPIPEPGLRHGP